VAGVVAGGALQGQQGLGGLGVAVDQRAGQQVREEADALDEPDLDPGRPAGRRGPDQVQDGLGVETARERVLVAAPAVRVVEHPPGLGEPAGQRPGEHAPEPLRDQQAGQAAGPQDGQGPAGGRGRLVHVLQHPVAQDQVGDAGAQQFGGGGGVALLGPDPVGDARLVRPALQRGQGVRARVHDLDPVPALGQRDRQAARAAAEVDHVEGGPADRLGVLDHEGVQSLPEHRGADRGTRLRPQGPATGPDGVLGHGSPPGRWDGAGARSHPRRWPQGRGQGAGVAGRVAGVLVSRVIGPSSPGWRARACAAPWRCGGHPGRRRRPA
jgi:hypothetical protein